MAFSVNFIRSRPRFVKQPNRRIYFIPGIEFHDRDFLPTDLPDTLPNCGLRIFPQPSCMKPNAVSSTPSPRPSARCRPRPMPSPSVAPCGCRALPEPRFSASRSQSSPEWATFVNGLLIRYLDFNDTYLSLEPAHPSDNLAAVLGVGKAVGAHGKDLILAGVLGYEIQCRLCDACSLRTQGVDHVTYGAISSAIAACKLLKLKAHKIAHAIGLAGVANVALRQTRSGELSMWKGCVFANAARNGVFAATLAAEGLSGPAPIFEGDLGFMKLVTRERFSRLPRWERKTHPPTAS